MNDENKDLAVTNVEETPLSQGQTVTDLQNQISDKAMYRSLKTQEIIGYSLSGAFILGGIIASVVTNNPIPTIGGITLASFPGIIGASAGKWVGYYRTFDNKSNQQVSEEETVGGISK
jgi:uncharacterized membrane protein YeaQ/YmgE (transglycosylase-associated protein family)